MASSFSSLEEERRSERLTYNLLSRKVQTNVAERALPIEYIAQSRRNRFADGVRWLDIGCGIMEGQSLLRHKETYGLAPVRVVGTHDDVGASERLNEILNRESIFTEMVGIDITDAYDENTYAWSRGSLRPSELKNEEFMQRFDALAAERLRKDRQPVTQTFIQGDALSDDDMSDIKKSHSGVQIVSAQTMAHQLANNAERQKLLDQGRALLDEQGILIITDFAWLPPHARAPAQLNFYRHWHVPFRYRTFMWDMAEPELGLQEVLRSKTSRCDIFQIRDKQFYEHP